MSDDGPLIVQDSAVAVGDDDVPVLEVIGELDTAASDQLLAAVAGKAGGGPARGRLVVDLDGVTFCDSRGLTALVAATTSAAREGVSVRFVAGADSAVRRLLARTGMGDLLALHASAGEAGASGAASRLEQEARGSQ